MSAGALSNKQFNTQRSLLEQSGDSSELVNQVRGFQHATANLFKPSFSEDYNTVRAMPSGTQFKGSEGMGEGEEGGM